MTVSYSLLRHQRTPQMVGRRLACMSTSNRMSPLALWPLQHILQNTFAVWFVAHICWTLCFCASEERTCIDSNRCMHLYRNGGEKGQNVVKLLLQVHACIRFSREQSWTFLSIGLNLQRRQICRVARKLCTKSDNKNEYMPLDPFIQCELRLLSSASPVFFTIFCLYNSSYRGPIYTGIR